MANDSYSGLMVFIKTQNINPSSVYYHHFRVNPVGILFDLGNGEHMCVLPPLKGHLWWRTERIKTL